MRRIGVAEGEARPAMGPRPMANDRPEFVAETVRDWIAALDRRTAFVEPGTSWENGCAESFNVRLRDALPTDEIFCSSKKARILIEQWRRQYKQIRPYAIRSTASP